MPIETIVSEKKVSILIPAYNVEQYIRMCLNSVINQTYGNLEIIVVNDGSTDSTPEIIDEFCNIDNRIISYSQKNSGLSATRNFLLTKFTGDYVFFLDSDDWLPLDSIEYLVNIIEVSEADMATGDIQRRENACSIDKEKRKQAIYSGKRFAEKMLQPAGYFCYACGRLFTAEGIVGASFPTKYVFEDIFTMPKLVAQCDKVVRTSRCIYYYRKNPSSISRRKFSRKATDEMDGYISAYHLGYELTDFILARNSIVFFLTKYYWYSLKVIFNGLGIGEFRQKYRKYVGWFWKQLLKGDFIENRALLENRLEPWR